MHWTLNVALNVTLDAQWTPYVTLNAERYFKRLNVIGGREKENTEEKILPETKKNGLKNGIAAWIKNGSLFTSSSPFLSTARGVIKVIVDNFCWPKQRISKWLLITFVDKHTEPPAGAAE